MSSKDLSNKFRHLKLADELFYASSKINFLFGADLLPQILASDDTTAIIASHPTSINTVLVWIFIGPADVNVSSHNVVSLHTYSEINDNLQKFWEIEEISRPPFLDPVDALAEKHFIKTHTRDASGRYVVSLPLKSISTRLGYNASRYFQSFIRLEMRLLRDSEAYNT